MTDKFASTYSMPNQVLWRVYGLIKE